MALITSDCDAMPYSPRIARFNQIKNGPMDFQVGHGLQLQPPMDNPCCSCKLIRVRHENVWGTTFWMYNEVCPGSKSTVSATGFARLALLACARPQKPDDCRSFRNLHRFGRPGAG